MTEQAARSEAAREASRRNGARSKGARTVLGRQISARNAFKHGLRSREAIAPGILPAWAMMIDVKLRATVGIIGQNRREHIDRLIPLIMQIDRVDRLIAEEFARLRAQLFAGAGSRDADNTQSVDPSGLEKLLRYRRRFSAARDKCLVQLTKYGLIFPLNRDRLKGKRPKKRKINPLALPADASLAPR